MHNISPVSVQLRLDTSKMYEAIGNSQGRHRPRSVGDKARTSTKYTEFTCIRFAISRKQQRIINTVVGTLFST